MFKSAFYCLAIIGCVCVFASCDGRDKAYKTPADSLKEKKLLDSFSENVQYFPKEYAEVETDTIMSNGFRVHITSKTEMDSTVLRSFTQDSIIHKHFYRDVRSNIVISHNDKLILETNLDKSYFKELYPSDSDFFEDAILQSTWLDDNHLGENEILINLTFCVPDTDHCIFYQMLINKEGEFTVTENETV